jgi:hypothetical protein
MALAISTGLPAITTDRAWGVLAISGLDVRLARQGTAGLEEHCSGLSVRLLFPRRPKFLQSRKG